MLDHFLEFFKNKNQHLLVYTKVCLLGGCICFILSHYSIVKIGGVNAWIKPLKFFLSIALFSFTMAIYVSFLSNAKQVTIYAWSFIVCMSIEVLLITLQAARGRKSHFNIETPLDNLILAGMGIAILAIVMHTFYIATLFFTQSQFFIGEEMILAIKMGFVLMLLFSLEGFVMVALNKHSMGGEDSAAGIPLFNWNKNAGDLRVAHFFGIHALQIIPMLAFILESSKREVYLISFIYFAFVTFTFIQAFQGRSFIK